LPVKTTQASTLYVEYAGLVEKKCFNHDSQPYIARALMSASNPPVQLSKIVIGNGLVGDFNLYPDLSAVSLTSFVHYKNH
jgi:hypothetical protein